MTHRAASYVHADVLRMAKTKEKRERIKWFHARRYAIGSRSTVAEGLEMARQCEHEDARFLVSLFPEGARPTWQEALAVFEDRKDDPRCLCWAVVLCPSRSLKEAIRRSEGGGYAWGQLMHASLMHNTGHEYAAWLEKAVAQGDSGAMLELGQFLKRHWSAVVDLPRGAQLLREAAELGEPTAQYEYALHHCPKKDSVEYLAWLRRSAMHHRAMPFALSPVAVERYLNLFDEGTSGRMLYEVGEACAHAERWHVETVIVATEEDPLVRLLNEAKTKGVAACKRAVLLFKQWRDDATRGVLCWLWLAKEKRVPRDIRLMIANLIWDDRAAWSERARDTSCGDVTRSIASDDSIVESRLPE